MIGVLALIHRLLVFIWQKISKIKNCSGYTLAELSISLTIIALLTSGALAIIAERNKSGQIALTKYRQNVIQEAIKSFIQAKNYLPCPALPQLIESDDNFGKSDGLTTNSTVSNASMYNTTTHICTNNNLTNEAGMVPVRTLNLDDEFAYDAWGRKFTYRTASYSGNFEDFSEPSFRGDINIVDLSGTPRTNVDNAISNSEGAIYVLVSYGANGGDTAWRRNFVYAENGSNYPGTTNGVEKQNTLHNAAKIYIQDKENSYFDDIVAYSTLAGIIQPKNYEAPIKIDNIVCNNAKAITKDGSTNLQNALNDNSFSTSLYGAAKKVTNMCDHMPEGYIASANPSSIPSMVAWYDASDLSTVWASNNCSSTIANFEDQVACLKDKSGNGNNALSTEGSRPIFKETALSNASSLLFSGNENMLIQNSGANAKDEISLLASNTNEYSVFIVGQSDDSGALVSQNGTIAGFRTYIEDTPSSLFKVNLLGAAEAQTSYDNKQFVLAVSWDKSTGKYYTKDNNYSLSTSGSTNINGQKITLGASDNGSSDKLTGYISEVIIYNRALHPRIMKGIKSYLASKWNIDDGTGNSNCPTGMIFTKTSSDPIGSCHCQETGKQVIDNMNVVSACFPDNTALSKCLTRKLRPFYDPSPITSNLSLWLDANDCTTISLGNNMSVTNWRDKSINGYNATADNDTAPLYHDGSFTNASGTNLAGIKFDSTLGQYFTLTTDKIIEDNNLSLYATIISGDTSSRMAIFSNRKDNAESSWQMEYGTRDTRLNSMSITGLFSNTEIWVARSADNILFPGVPYIFEYFRSNTGQQIFINGILQTLTDDNATGNNFLGNNSVKLIGTGPNLDETQMFDGTIGEIMAYSSRHDDTQRASMENYLSGKWGINLSIPTNPYPGSIALNPVIWLDASKPNPGGSNPNDNDTISSWKDRATNTVYTAQGAPIYKTNQQNALATILFPTTDSYIITQDAATLFNSGNSSISLVYSSTSSSQNRALFGTYTSGGRIFAYHSATNNFMAGLINHDQSDAINSSTAFSGINNYSINTIIASSGGQVKLYHNGSWQNATLADAGSFAANSFLVGSLDDGSNNSSNIAIAEFVAYNAKLTKEQRKSVENYLSAKWGIGL